MLKRVWNLQSLSLIFVICFCIVKALCLIPFILLFSKPQLRNCGQSGVSVPCTPTHHCMQAAAKLCEISCMQRSCKPFIISSVTPPCLRDISVVKILLYSVPASFSSCMLIRLRTSVPGKRGSQAL